MRENQFKQIYNNAYKKSLENNNRAHKQTQIRQAT